MALIRQCNPLTYKESFGKKKRHRCNIPASAARCYTRLMPMPAFRSIPLWLGLALLLAPLSSCAQPQKQLAASPPPAAAPPPPCVVAALRPVSSASDPEGALAQIMSILQQPLTPASGTEIIVRLPDNSVHSLVQSDASSLAPGIKAGIFRTPAVSIQPY